MELRQLRSFVAIARERSFTRAARQLGVAQPALSQQLAALERSLGVLLIERSNRTLGLTPAGEALLSRAERILLEAQGAADEMSAHAGLKTDTVRLGCALQTLMEGPLPALLVAFQARHPGLRINFTETHSAQVLDLLGRGEVDLGLVHLARSGPDAEWLGREGASPAVTLLQLYREPLQLIVHPRHRLARRPRVAFADLRDEAFIAFRGGSTIRALVSAAAEESGFVPRIAMATPGLGSVRALVSVGLGVAVVPRSALETPGPPLRALDLEPRFERAVTLARNTVRYGRPAVAAAYRFLKQGLGKRS